MNEQNKTPYRQESDWTAEKARYEELLQQKDTEIMKLRNQWEVMERKLISRWIKSKKIMIIESEKREEEWDYDTVDAFDKLDYLLYETLGVIESIISQTSLYKTLNLYAILSRDYPWNPRGKCDEAGRVFFELNLYEEACEVYAKLSELDSQNDEYWIFWGIALFYREKFVEACEKLAKGIEINSQDDEYWIIYGIILNASKKFDEALKKLNQALEINPQNLAAQRMIQLIPSSTQLDRDKQEVYVQQFIERHITRASDENICATWAEERGFPSYALMKEAKRQCFHSYRLIQVEMKKGGFPSFESMQEAQKRGFSTYISMQEANEAGFPTYKIMQEVKESGFSTFVSVLEETKRTGFSSYPFMLKARKQGFSTYENWLVQFSQNLDKSLLQFQQYRQLIGRKILANPRKIFKVIFTGDGGAGRTTLLRYKLTGKFDQTTSMTIGVNAEYYTIDQIPHPLFVVIFDLAGQTRWHFMHKAFILGSKAGFVFYDLTRSSSFDHIPYWIELLQSENPSMPIIICGTKSDLVSPDILFQNEEAFAEMCSHLPSTVNIIAHLQISNKNPVDCDKVFEYINLLAAKFMQYYL